MIKYVPQTTFFNTVKYLKTSLDRLYKILLTTNLYMWIKISTKYKSKWKGSRACVNDNARYLQSFSM